MASSEKPDFIEIDEKTPSVKLTEGPDASDSSGKTAGADNEKSSGAQSAAAETTGPRPAFSLAQGAQNHYANGDNAVAKKVLPVNRPMRKLPFGPVTFIGLLVVLSTFGNQIDEMRKQTLAALAGKLYLNSQGYVETVSDLSWFYRQNRNLPAAKAALNKGLATLAANDQDKGAKGALLRLRLVSIAFQEKDEEAGRALANTALSMINKGGTYVPYETPLLLYLAAWNLDNYWDYKTALPLNLKAIELWPNNRPNYRSSVQYDIGFEYNRLKQYEKAEGYLKQALSQSLSWGDDDDNVRRFLQLGISQLGQKKYPEAETNLNSALRMQQTLSRRKKDTQLAQIYSELGKVRAAQGDLLMARKYLERAAETLKSKRNSAYHYLLNQHALANLYRDIGETNLATPIYESLLSRLRDGERGPDIKDVQRDVDLMRAKTGGG